MTKASQAYNRRARSGPNGGAAEALAAILTAHRRRAVVTITGAGISVASGIPTFRGSDPGAVWRRDVLELGTRRFFMEDPAGSWRWYLKRFDRVLSAQPNAAHHALVALERWQEEGGGRFLLVTQNVDPLHERAGSRRLVKVHGDAARVRCSRDGCVHGAPDGSLPRASFDLESFRADPRRERLPTCPACGALLRQHVLWFDEFYQGHRDYGFERVMAAADTASLLLFVGTSFSVGITELLLATGWRSGAAMVAVDPAGGLDRPLPGVRFVAAAAEALLPAVCAQLGAALPAAADR